MKLLLVEDSERLQRSISAGLRRFGYAVDQAEDGQRALAFAESNLYDVIILDLMLPQMDGLTVLATLRKQRNSANVLILSARDQVEDRIRGLDLGADDYLVKPFSFDELVARIRALVRRHSSDRIPTIGIGPLHIDTLRREVRCDDEPLPLTPSEFSLLKYLVQRRGQVFSHDQLIDRLYDSVASVSKNAIEVHISQLRKKLKAAGAPALIKTKRGFGYYVDYY